MKMTVVAAALLLAGANSLAKAPPPDPRVVSARTTFGFDLLHQLSKTQGKNVFVSPSSIATALEMTYNGASGQTRAEMAKTLHISGLSLDALNNANQSLRKGVTSGDPKVKIAVANSLWAQRKFTFLPDFIARNLRYYDAAVRNVDFANPTTTDLINRWVKQHTNGKIVKLLPPLDVLTRLVLVNAVYFHGMWTDQFTKAATHPQPFHLQNGATKNVPMMSRTGEYSYLKGPNFQAIRLPYGSGRFAMYVFLPDPDNLKLQDIEFGLPAILKTLDRSNWDRWLSQMHSAHGSISLPRFKVEYSQALNEPLKALGMRQAFDIRSADFGGMTGKPDLYVSLVQHKAYVDVNEEGTEAAAATAVVMTMKAMRPSPGFAMVVDHPFLCAIRDDKTGEILFLGAIYDPTQN